MTVTSADVLNRHLNPFCPRDNHVMKYEFHGPRPDVERRASYHRGFDGCSVRYDANDGYHTLLRVDEHCHRLEEPGVNTFKCPRHNSWLYRKEDLVTKPGVRWCCGIDGCGYCLDAPTKGAWVRT
jgi:hypothetical protein